MAVVEALRNHGRAAAEWLAEVGSTPATRRTTLLALARGSNVKMKMGVMDFGFSEDQMALFRSFDPTPANENAPAADGEEKPAVKNDADEKEMEEAEMKKKK